MVILRRDAAPLRLLSRAALVRSTYALAIAACVAPLFTIVGLLDVLGALVLAAGALRLAHALANQLGPARLAGTTSVALGLTLLLVSGQGIWSLPVMFAAFLAFETLLRIGQAVRRDNLRLYAAGVLAGLVALGIWQEVFCGGYALFGPLVGVDLAAVAWAHAAAGGR